MTFILSPNKKSTLKNFQLRPLATFGCCLKANAFRLSVAEVMAICATQSVLAHAEVEACSRSPFQSDGFEFVCAEISGRTLHATEKLMNYEEHVIRKSQDSTCSVQTFSHLLRLLIGCPALAKKLC